MNATEKLVMVVDDDEALRDSVCELLGDDGYETVGMDGGSSALEHLCALRRKPDLILLDLMMPGMNGWQFRQEQLGDPTLAGIPVVVMTATREVQGISAEEVLYKPFSRARLLEAVGRYLDSGGVQASERPSRPPRRSEAPGSQPPPPSNRQSGHTHDVLHATGAMGALVRTMDWGGTSLGPVDTWSISLRTLVSAVLQSRFPMMLWWGRDLVVIYNDAYQPMLGDKHPRAMGASAREVWAEIWEVLGPQADGVLDGGPATWNEHLLLFLERKGFVEETYWTFSYSPARDDSGAVGGVLVTVQETTEQVQGERQLEMLREVGARPAVGQAVEDACRAAATTLGKYDKDIPFGLLYLLHADGSTSLCAQVGWQQGAVPPELSAWPIDELAASGRPLLVAELGERWGALLGGPWKRRLTQAVLLELVGGNQAQPYGYLVLGVSPVRALDDAYTRMFRLVGDQIVTSISAARTFEEERRRAEALAEIDRAKTTFFSNVSHEFRTPLTLILGPTEDLLNGAHGQLDARQQEQLELMHRNELRLQKLVNALLDFSRIEAGRVEACFQATDLAALTRDLAGSFRAAVDRAGLELHVDCPALDAPVFVDRDMWEKIVVNLLSNALKFTFEGKITLSLSATNDSAILRVADTGIGIAEAEMPRLFERFHRIQGVRARTHEGSGIGLALVTELAKMHGGSIVAESRPGIGTTFTVTIPKGKAHLPKERLGSTPGEVTARGVAPYVQEALRWLPSVARAPETAGASRILVADDNADMRDYLRRLLEPHWEVETATDGLEALASARAHAPMLLIADIMMPGLDGFSLLGELRKEEATRTIPVIMLSARAGEEAKLEGLRAGAEDYLVKPFSARELLARVRTHLELARLRSELRVQREHLYSMFMQAPIAICVLHGADLVFEMANPLYLDIIGRRDVLGRPLLDGLPELRGQGFDTLLREVMKTGESYVGKERLARLDRHRGGALAGTYFTFIYAPIRGEDGAIDRVMVVVSDVTAEVSARRLVEESEEKFRRIVSQVQAGIAQTDLSGRFTLTNDRYREIVGRSEAELSQLTIRDVTHAEDLGITLDAFENLVRSGSPAVLEKRYTKPDGSIVWVQDSISRVQDRDGRPEGAVAVTIDITKRRFAEQALLEAEQAAAHLAAIVTSSDDAIISTELDGTIRSWNKSAEHLYGYTANEVLGQSVVLLVPLDRPNEEPDILRRIAAGETIDHYETVRRRKDGRMVEISLTVSPVRDGRGHITGAAKIARDIGEQKRVQREREARVAEIERSLEFSERFVGILGHDLRNPLGAIITASELLLRREHGERIARPIQRIHNSAERMTRMIEQILDLTRARIGGGIPIRPTAIDLGALVANLVEELEGAAPQQIEVVSAGDLHGHWDGDRLGQVVSNLLANAIEHGEASAVVRLTLDGTGAEVVRFSVWNAGVVPTQLLPIMFEPFRGATATSRKGKKTKGLGLGLYIVQQLVHAHLGTVEVRSSVEGTTFVVTLPRVTDRRSPT